MEKWDHAVLRCARDNYGVETVTIARGPDYFDATANIDAGQSGESVLRWLDLLGGDGWQLVTVRETPGRTEYWLKRVRPE